MMTIIIALIDTWFQWQMAILGKVGQVHSISQAASILVNTAGTVVTFLREVNFIVPIPTIFTILVLNMSMTVILWIIWLMNKIVNLVADVIP